MSLIHLRIEPPEPVRVGSEPTLQLRMDNTATQAVWLNTRLVLNAEHAPPAFREVWLDVTGPDGQQRPFECRVRAGFPTTSNYTLLPPGDHYQAQIHLGECFDFSAPGSYRIVAHYQDGGDDVETPNGATRIKTPVHAGEVTLEVVAP